MESISELETYLLLNYIVGDEDIHIPSVVKQVFDGKYELLLQTENLLSLLKTSDNIEETIVKLIETDADQHLNWLSIGIASLFYFIQHNWTGPSIKVEIENFSHLRERALKNLSLHDECNENTSRGEFLYLAKLIFSNKQLQSSFESCSWWLFRANFIHQLILDDYSTIIFEESEKLMENISKFNLLANDCLKTIFNLEITYFYLSYKRVQNSEKYFEIAEKLAGLKLELQGALGVRTKYQQVKNAQLFLKVEIEKELFPSRSCDIMPVALNLNDDLRLEKIQFSEETQNVKLGSIEEAIVMTKYFQLQISQPKHQLTFEEITPYLSRVIENTNNWSLKLSSLYQRCVNESNHKRTIERSIAQMEYLIDQVNDDKVQISYRMDLFFVSGLRPKWSFKQMLADQKLNLGLVKGALDLYLSLHLWEDVILCYTILGLKHKAAEIIKQEIDKKPSVKLWCLLGDAMEEEGHYETAWKLSEGKSSRAQRHWGIFHFNKKNYVEAVPHLKLSAELNNIQETVWSRLGFACLQIENWELAATAYRKFCALEQSSFEAWNNLAKAYIKLGEKQRAFRALQDAIKCNYDRWEVWDNLMVVSIDLGRFTEVIRCYHRIIEIKGQHLDVQILNILSRAIIDDINDAEGNSSRIILSKALELFGRITSTLPNNSEVWRLYAELNSLQTDDINNQKTAQYLQRAYRASVSDPKWYQRIESIENVLNMCIKLSDAYENCSKNCSDQQKRSLLGSAKLSLQSVIKKVKDQELSEKQEIIDHLMKVEEKLEIILSNLEKIK
ncbi:tetratricopeptide repeat protein 27 [Leptopilina heterotoma]|uniref:tetratricopeptide repeat protein 27 n=1 Tax=Leptopilina heterotoma TaxID=63436 RepID=UPI001CA80879|nr:tetratricopeptide repeat protein 27 [Leptopilina heterotoma]